MPFVLENIDIYVNGKFIIRFAFKISRSFLQFLKTVYDSKMDKITLKLNYKIRGVIFSTIPNHNPFYVLFRFLLIDHHNKITKNEKINF